MLRSASLVLVTSLSLGGLTVPRSAGFGQTAYNPSAGGGDVGVTTGAAYQSLTSQSQSLGTTNTTTLRTLIVPSVEGNALIGVTDVVGLDLHLSLAGIQPGLKFSYVKEPLAIAIMPSGGIGYSSTVMSSVVSNGSTSTEMTPPSTTTFSALVGLKVFFSHQSGLYGGIGYDYQYFNFTGASPSSNVTTSSWHNLLFAAGFELPIASLGLKVRPEVALLWSPIMTGSTQTAGGMPTDQSGQSLVYFFPNITIAMQSPYEGSNGSTEEARRRSKEKDAALASRLR